LEMPGRHRIGGRVRPLLVQAVTLAASRQTAVDGLGRVAEVQAAIKIESDTEDGPQPPHAGMIVRPHVIARRWHLLGRCPDATSERSQQPPQPAVVFALPR
jgi:hypothetical protein